MQNTESLLRLHAYWAKLELSIGKDLAGARGVWENFMKKRFSKPYPFILLMFRLKLKIIQADYTFFRIRQLCSLWFILLASLQWWDASSLACIH